MGKSFPSVDPPIKKTKSERNKPLEFSCRRPVAVPKPAWTGQFSKREKELSAITDPRFNREIAGEYDAKRFGSSYSFLNDYRHQEKRELETILSSKKTSLDDKERIQKELTRMNSQDVARERIATEQQIRSELRRQEQERVSTTGKKEYFHPRSVVKKILNERREETLKKAGKLDKFKAQRERRDAAKEKKASFPLKRRVVEA